MWVIALTAATGFSAGADTIVKINVEAAAERLSAKLLDTKSSMHRPPLTGDAEHARTIDPVLTEGTAIWIHEALPAPPLTIMGGRVLTYRDVPYDPLEAPLLKIRPIDDDQRIPFLLRVVLWPGGVVPPHAALDLSLPAPPIFNPRLTDVTAWVGPRQVHVTTDRSAAAAAIGIHVPLAPAGAKRLDDAEKPITVIIEGVLLLGSYDSLSQRRFVPIHASPYDPAAARLSEIQIGRDVVNDGELQRFREIAGALAPENSTDYEKVVAVNSWVADSLQYRESPASRTPLEALEDQSGDCDDHSALMVAMLRSMGIAARQATGLLYDLNTLSAHAWVEAALPAREGDLHWFLIDPTLAGTTTIEAERSSFVQFKDRILLYPFRPTVSVEGVSGHLTTDALLNWRGAEETLLTGSSQLDEFIDIVVEGVDQNILQMAGDLSEHGLLLRRQSSTIAGSPYILVDRSVTEKNDGRLRLLLENEERLVLELAAGVGRSLDSETDLETIEHLSRAYSDLNDLFFAGAPAYRNLELVFDRDRHTDRLHTVRLRIGRYLLEHHLDRILKKLKKHRLLTEAEAAELSEISEVSGGRNLYVLQELARQHEP